MKEFFSFLAKKRLSANKFDETLSRWSPSDGMEFIEESQERLAHLKSKHSRDHSFISNTQLSGGKSPCVAVECRLNHVDQLARFAALYADQVLIHDPFEYYDHESKGDIRQALSDDLRILYYLRPLLEDGRISLASRTWHYCEEHYNEVIVQSKLHEKLERARKALSRRFTSDTKVYLETSQAVPLLKITGPEQLIEHGVSYHVSAKARPLVDVVTARGNNLLSKKEIRDYGVFEGPVSTIINDILVQNLYARNGFNYLTDREVDFDIIAAVNDNETNALSKAILEGLSHTVPFIRDVGLQKLIKLRKDEGESFQVYRDTLNALLKNLEEDDLRNVKTVKEAFNDSIRPELNKIDLAIKNSKKLLYGSVKRDILFGAGFIGLGLFSGLLPEGVGQLIAALGGYRFASGVADKVVRSLKEPDAVRDNKYYFLWKVREKTKDSMFSKLNRTLI
jgi:hypothetical protein